MRFQWWWQALFIGLCFLAIIHADKKCGGECKGKAKDSVYNFEDGTVYTYEVEGLSLTQLPGSPNDVSKISITASAEISAQPKCTYVLKLSNVHVSGADGKKHDGLSADCAKPIKFSFNNGQLSPELCTEDDDNGAALNIKRAVISLFQTSDEVGSNSRNDISYETDIFGSCPTNYAITKNGGNVNVVKSRNLNRCAHRESFDLPVLSTPYYSQKTDFQSSPLIAAKLTVNQDIEDGILKKASSEEEYEYRPALSAEYAAKIINKVSITSIGSKKGSIPANGNEQQSIIFESPHPSHGVGNAGSIVKALKTVVNNVDPAVDHSAADDFLELVDELAHGTKADILTVYSQIKSGAGFKDKEVAKGLLLDGLLYTGSSESVEAAAELLHSKEFSESGSIKWYLDLNFVKHVSKASIKAVTPLLDGKAPHQAYLGIGALAGKYCRQHDCEGVQEFQQLLKKLATPIFYGCKVKSVEEENNVIASLKGLANVQLITDEVAAKLVQCAEDGTVKTRVRSAALSAFTSNKLLKSSAIKIFKDIEEDAELRIKAYLALVASPCGKVADVIKETIDKEPINQVGSFIVSHLRNLRATTNPDKEAAKYFLGEIIPNKRFPFDIRKFSQNRELSYSLDTLNIGAVGEANTIYSQKSYLPRYVNLNLTSNIFGHSFNFLEIGARAENLEYLFEKYFGPKGAYNKHPNEVIEATAEATENFYHRYQKNYRNRRSITQKQINDVAKKVKFGVDNEDRTVDLDLSVKLFGAEIGWFKLNGDTTTSLEQFYNKVTGRVGESVDKLKNFDLDYQKARVFLDATVTYPTALGLALKFKVLGGSAAKIKIDSKLDVKEIIRAIKESNTHLNTDIKFQLIPSASIELNSLITMDADVLQTGVKVSANLHSSTGTDISLRILDGSGIDLKVGIPVKNQELVSFKSSIVSVVREKGQPESSSPVNFNTKRSEYSGCFDQLTPFIGLTFCGEISAPMEGFRALSPAYGPSKLVLRIEKEDDSLTSYHFKAHYDNKDPNAVEFLVVLDTPNSKSDRKLGLIIGAKSKPRQEISLKAISPWKKITAEAFVTDTDTEQSINAKLNDNDEEYTLKIGAKLSGNENHKKYEPLLEYKEPQGGGKHWSLIGRKGGAKGGKTQQSLGVTGAVIVDKTPNGKKYDLKSVTITTSAVKVTLDGDINVESNYVGSDLNIALDKTAIKLASKFKWDEKKCSAHVNFVPEQQKEMGFDFKLNLEEDKQKFSNKLVFIHGPDLNSEEARFTLENYLQYNFESVKSFDFEAKNSVTYPLLGLLAKIEIEASPKELELDLEGGFNKFTIKGDLKAKTATKHVGDYSIDFSGKVLDNGIQLTAKHDVISDTKSKFTNSLELTPGGKYQLNAIVLHDFKGKNINHAIDAELKIPYDPKLVKLNTKLVNNKAESTVVFILVGGNKPIVEIKGTIAKTNKPEGNFKVYLPKYIDSKGSFKFDGHNGVGSFSADFPKTTRQIAGKGEISLTSTNYKGFGEVQWDVKNNPAKKVRIETDTDYSKNSVDSKNSLQVSDCKATLNMKGNLDGKITDGTLKGEAELVLNNGRKVNVKLDRELHIRPDGTDIDAAYEIAHFETQGAQPQKVALKLKGKNIDFKKAIFDGQVDLSYTSKNQDNVVVHVVGKKVPQGDKWAISGEGSVSGSIVKKIDVKLDSELSNAFLKGEYVNNGELPPASYHLTANDANSGVSVSVNGKMNGHQCNNELDLKLPADLPINTVKWTSNNFLNYRPSDGQNIKVKYDNKVTWNGDKFVKVNVEASREPKGVSGKVEWESHLKSQRSLSGKVTQDVVNDIVNTDIEGLFTYEGKSADLLVKVNCKQDGSVVNVDAVANLPEKGKYSANLKHKETKVSDSERTRDSVLVLNGDGKTVTITSFLEVQKPNLLVVKFLVEAPQGKSGIYVKSVKKGNRHYDIEQKFNWISRGGGNLDLDIEFDLEDIKDFIIKVAADSPKLEINKFQFDVGSKAAVKTGGQRVTFSAKTADKDIFSGHANYQVKDNLPASLIINGKGVLNVGKETYPLTVNCDYDEKDHSVSLDIDAKPFTFNSIIEKKFPSMKSSHKFCKESVCSLVEFKQTVQLDENFESASIEREITIDLESLLANNHKFNYKQLLKKDGLTLDHKINLDYGKYSSEYHSYIKPSEAGIAFTLPNRIIAFELSYDDFLKTKGFPALVEATFYPNKKNPSEKSCLSFKTNQAKFVSNGGTGPFSSELRFSSPGLRDLVIKSHGEVSADHKKIDGHLELDIFSSKENAVFVEYFRNIKKDNNQYLLEQTCKIHSNGQRVDIQESTLLGVSKQGFNLVIETSYVDFQNVKQEGIFKLQSDKDNQVFLMKIPEGTIISIDNKITYSKDGFRSEGSYELAGKKVTDVLTFNKNSLNHITKYGKDNYAENVGLAIGQLAEYKATFNNQPIINFEVKLDELNFLKTTFDYNVENLKALVESIKQFDLGVYEELSKMSKALFKRLLTQLNDRSEVVRKALPDLNPIFNAYKTHLQKLREEFENDESLVPIFNALKKFQTVFIDQIVRIYEQIEKNVKQFIDLANDTWAKLNQTVKQFLPKIIDAYNKVNDAVLEVIKEFYNVASKFIILVLEEAKKYDPEVKEFLGIIIDFVSDFGVIVSRTAHSLQAEISEYLEVLKEQIAALPVFSMLKEKLEELKQYQLPEHILGIFAEFVQTAKQAAPTPEVEAFITTSASYIEKILKHEPVDNSAELKAIYTNLVKAIRSLIPFIVEQDPKGQSLQFFNIIKTRIIRPLQFYQAPKGGFRLNLFSLLRSPDLPSLSEVYHTYKPTKHFLDYFPPYKAYASITDSTEMVTFDGRQLSFKGSCGYVLVQDYIDGNFSVSAVQENGKIKSIAISDKKNFVELKPDHSVIVNGKSTEFPVQIGDIIVWRVYNSLGFYVASGLKVFCSESLEHCSFILSGFYFAKTRGLLGTYNNEPYDDLTAPAGEVSKSTSEFGNAWKTSPQCSNVPQIEHSHVHIDQCTEYFTSGSPFQHCFATVDPSNYRKTCDHKVQDNKEALCEILFSYTANCMLQGVHINVPKECVSCKSGSQILKPGDSVSVQTPQKSADIVFFVEELNYNEEVYKSMVVPLVQLLTTGLKEKGITDVKFALIGFGYPGQYWPAHYTTNGQIGYKGKAKISFGKPHNESKGELVDKIRFLKSQFDLEFGLTPWHKGLQEVMFYPFRPEAVKSVVAVYGKPCEKSVLPLSSLPLKSLLGQIAVIRSGIKLNVITPLTDLSIEGKDSKSADSIVGFDAEAVYVQGDAKKKTLRGDEELFKHIKYSPDTCIDFAQSVDGAVFTSDNFIHGKAGLRKNFLQVLSHKVVNDLTGVEIQQECSCEIGRFYPITRCNVVSRREKEPLAKVVKGVKG